MIEVEGLTKRYGERTAVDALTFNVPRGQVLGFLGPNGAGKSTTMRMLTGYISASGGRARIAGYDVFRQSVEVRRRLGYLPENNPLYLEMRVEDHLALACRLRGVEPRLRAGRIDYAIEACGLAERRREVVGRLSKGLRQRVGLAQAVVHDPELLILDEPTAGLDPAQTRETRDLIAELGRHHTVVLSSHVLSEIAATCERVLIINRGSLVADDSPDNLARRLTAGRGMEVDLVLRGSPEAARAALEHLEVVREVRVTGSAGDEARVVVESDSEDPREAIAAAVVTAGLGLRELRSRTLSLEDVFIALTSEDGSDGGPGAPSMDAPSRSTLVTDEHPEDTEAIDAQAT